jgi:hypothetical protein
METGKQLDYCRRFVLILVVVTGAQQDGGRHFISLSTVNRKCDNYLKYMAMVDENGF